MERLLPIGSVVKLKEMKKAVMIFGLLQKCGVENEQVVDYIGVPYPEGNIGTYAQIGFQKSDIEEVLFTGYVSDEYLQWSQRIDNYFDNSKKEE